MGANKAVEGAAEEEAETRPGVCEWRHVFKRMNELRGIREGGEKQTAPLQGSPSSFEDKASGVQRGRTESRTRGS
eukprot:4569147-Pleurochrysis_carterae.AAC.1